MANPFFNALGGRQSIPGPMGNMQNMIQQFNQFRQTFKGNPQEEVQRLLQSGRITQEQLNQAQAMAQQISHFLK